MQVRRSTLAAVLTLVCAACGAGTTGGGTGGRPPSGGTPSPAVTALPPAPTGCAAGVLAGMTEAQRVGQLFLAGLQGNRLGASETDAIRSHHVGSVWFTVTSTAGVGAIRAVSDAVQAEATPAATAGVRFLVAANQEGGQVQALRGPGFSTIPPATAQGAMDPAALQAQAAGWGRELAAAGVNLDFAPVLDVVPPGTDAQNQPIGALQREYGHDPATAGSHGAAMVRGLAGAGVASTVKHFPGLGRVAGNTDFAAGVVDTATTADDPFLQSFRQGIDAGAQFAMVALATYTRIDPGHLAAFSPAVIRLLRGGLGFGGVIVSDDVGAAAAVAAIPTAQRAVDFLAAGGDMVVSRNMGATLDMIGAVLARAAADPAFRADVDVAAGRVLRAKQALGLLPCHGP